MKTFLHSSKDKQSLSNWSLRQKAGFFVFLALFAICIGMACFFNGFSLPNLLILIAIAIVSMVIYVLPISLHPVVKAVITIILPTAAFFLLESMTHVVWETMEIDAVLLNLVFYYLFFLFFFFVSGSTKISLDILLIFTMIVWQTILSFCFAPHRFCHGICSQLELQPLLQTTIPSASHILLLSWQLAF